MSKSEKKKAGTQEKEFDKSLPVKFTDAEIRMLKDALALSTSELIQLEDEKAEQNKAIGEEIKTVRSDIVSMAKKIKDGFENRLIKCKAIFYPDKDKAEIVRTDSGEIIGSRSMTPDEYQMEIFS